jgi:hypothetical protein
VEGQSSGGLLTGADDELDKIHERAARYVGSVRRLFMDVAEKFEAVVQALLKST